MLLLYSRSQGSLSRLDQDGADGDTILSKMDIVLSFTLEVHPFWLALSPAVPSPEKGHPATRVMLFLDADRRSFQGNDHQLRRKKRGPSGQDQTSCVFTLIFRPFRC